MKNKHGMLLTFLLMMLLVTAGCSTKKEEIAPGADASLLTGDWVLIEPTSVYTVTLRIESATAQLPEYNSFRLSGRSSVNHYFATANFSKKPSVESGQAGTGSIQGLGATRMAGSPEAMRFENDYFAQLEAVNRAELVGSDKLRLSYGGATAGVLVYKRQ